MKRLTDKQIRNFFWDSPERVSDNKASYLLGGLSVYGVSRCKKGKGMGNNVLYEFDIYQYGDFRVAVIIELSMDFTLKEIEQTVLRLWETGGFIASDDVETFKKWRKEIEPTYGYEHAKFSALRFLESLRKRLIMKITSKAKITDRTGRETNTTDI